MTSFRRALWAILALAFVAAPAAIVTVARATVVTAAYSTLALGTGAQTVFPFSFVGVGTQYIAVVYTDASGNQTTLAQGPGASQYQVSLAAPIGGQTWGVGGTVTYNPGGTPIPVGSSLTIYRTLPLYQMISMQNKGSVAQLGLATEQMGDLLTMQAQQTAGLFGRAIVANIANSAPPNPLPPAAQMANKGLCGDSTGNNLIACVLPSSGVISSAMQPVVSASSIANGRTALGLGSIATEGIGAALQDDGSGNVRVNLLEVDDAISQAVASSFHMTRRNATGPLTYTLARANTYWNGFGFYVSSLRGGSAVTLAIDSHDNFINQASGASFSLRPGQVAFIHTNAATAGVWHVDISDQQGASVAQVNAQTGTSYTVLQSDWGATITRANASAMADTLPQAVGNFAAGFWFEYQNKGTAIAVLTPTTSTISGLTSLVVPPNTGVKLVSDGANWQAVGQIPTQQGRWLLNTLTASAGVTTALQDTTSFGLGFSTYEIVMDNFIGSTATDGAVMQVYSASYQTASYVAYSYYNNSAGASAIATTAGLYISNYAVGTATVASPYGKTVVRATAPAAGGKVMFDWRGAVATTGPYSNNEYGSGYWNGGSTAITGFQIYPTNSVSTPAVGRTFGAATVVKVYGLR